MTSIQLLADTNDQTFVCGLPLTNEVLIGTLGVFGDCFLSVSQRFDVVLDRFLCPV